MSLKVRIIKLELARRSQRRALVPCVVSQQTGEALEEAVARKFEGVEVPDNHRVIVTPELLSEEDWVARYSPGATRVE